MSEVVMSTEQGYEQLAAGRFEEAIETFSLSLLEELVDAKALRGRGLAYVQLKQWPLAIADFDGARKLAPEQIDNWVDLGMSLAMDHQVYPAIEVFETLLTKHPECVRAHIELGLLHLRIGAIPKGVSQLQRGLERRPTLTERRFIESVLRQQEQLDQKRYYRPDFEALNRKRRRGNSSNWIERLLSLLRRARKSSSKT